MSTNKLIESGARSPFGESQRRFRRRAKAIAGGAAFVGLTLGMTAGTASAATPLSSPTTDLSASDATYNSYYDYGCWVQVSERLDTEIAPSGVKAMRFAVKFSCEPNREIRYERQLWEQDNGEDQLVHSGFGLSDWKDATSGTKVYTVWFGQTSSHDDDRMGEFYQKVRVQVRIKGEQPWPMGAWNDGPVSPTFI